MGPQNRVAAGDFRLHFCTSIDALSSPISDQWARAPRRTARKKGSGYENGVGGHSSGEIVDFQREFYACSAIVTKYKQSI